jgi:hypothetical protein
MREGSHPAAAQLWNHAIGSKPNSASLSSETTRQAEAASFCWLALPAVTTPSFSSARNFPKLSAVASARTPSSMANSTGSPFFCGTATGTSSSSNLPAAQAAAARWWLAAAYSSHASREIL